MRSAAGELEESFLEGGGVSAFFQAGRRVAGEKLATVEDGDTISEEVDFLESVGGEEQGGIAGFQNVVFEKIAKFGGGNGVEAARRFVEQQDARMVKERARQAQALHGAGGKRPHLAIESVLELELRGELSDTGSYGG